MEGYSQNEYFKFTEQEDEDEDDDDWKKKKIKYTTILKEEEFVEED